MVTQFDWLSLWDSLHKEIKNADTLLDSTQIISLLALMDRLECEMLHDKKRKTTQTRRRKQTKNTA